MPELTRTQLLYIPWLHASVYQNGFFGHRKAWLTAGGGWKRWEVSTTGVTLKHIDLELDQ